jgi:hypothetical protein
MKTEGCNIGGGTVKGYCSEYDAYFSYATDRWLEGKCHDEGCTFCTTRSAAPSQCPHEHAPIVGAVLR